MRPTVAPRMGAARDATLQSAAELAGYLVAVETALDEAVKRFAVDLAKPNAPAGKPAPVR